MASSWIQVPRPRSSATPSPAASTALLMTVPPPRSAAPRRRGQHHLRQRLRWHPRGLIGHGHDPGNSISDNHIGIDVDGAATIGGTSSGAGNTISGNRRRHLASGLLGHGHDRSATPSPATPRAASSSRHCHHRRHAQRHDFISGNGTCGIDVEIGGSPAITGNTIASNRGPAIVDGAATIGGTSSGAGNTISGNGGDGIDVYSGHGHDPRQLHRRQPRRHLGRRRRHHRRDEQRRGQHHRRQRRRRHPGRLIGHGHDPRQLHLPTPTTASTSRSRHIGGTIAGAGNTIADNGDGIVVDSRAPPRSPTTPSPTAPTTASSWDIGHGHDHRQHHRRQHQDGIYGASIGGTSSGAGNTISGNDDGIVVRGRRSGHHHRRLDHRQQHRYPGGRWRQRHLPGDGPGRRPLGQHHRGRDQQPDQPGLRRHRHRRLVGQLARTDHHGQPGRQRHQRLVQRELQPVDRRVHSGRRPRLPAHRDHPLRRADPVGLRHRAIVHGQPGRPSPPSPSSRPRTPAATWASTSTPPRSPVSRPS